VEIGEKIRTMRLQNRMTLADLSERSGVSKSLLSMIERGRSVPTLTTFQKIADAFGIAVSSLFSDDETAGPGHLIPANPQKPSFSVFRTNGSESKNFTVVHGTKRKKMMMPWGAYYEMLCPDLQHSMEFIYLSYPVDAKLEEFYSHNGEECGVVLEGRFRGIIGEQEVVLEPGDSIYYDSSIPHRWENAGEIEVKAIWAITPPSF
jgi:transcriptional regulator with XRE-family HTH domain/mannose-6-phosphate isomerase-like protein (cupin superfamily)